LSLAKNPKKRLKVKRPAVKKSNPVFFGRINFSSHYVTRPKSMLLRTPECFFRAKQPTNLRVSLSGWGLPRSWKERQRLAMTPPLFENA